MAKQAQWQPARSFPRKPPVSFDLFDGVTRMRVRVQAPLHQAEGVSGDGMLQADTTVDGIPLGFKGWNPGEQDGEQDSEGPDLGWSGLVWVSLQDLYERRV
jgi:hypothetical protein